MSSIFPNGSQYSFSTALAAATNVTAVTNAAPPLLTDATPPSNGSIVVVNSGWSALNQTAWRVTGSTGTTFSLEGADTTNTTLYPAGGGAGSVQVASTFVGLSQITDATVSGGDQQFYQFQYVDDITNRQRQKPTFKNAMVLTITMDYDPTLAWYAALQAADLAQVPVVLLIVLPNGNKFYNYVYPSFNPIPTSQKNQNQQVTATFSLIAPPVRYTS